MHTDYVLPNEVIRRRARYNRGGSPLPRNSVRIRSSGSSWILNVVDTCTLGDLNPRRSLNAETLAIVRQHIETCFIPNTQAVKQVWAIYHSELPSLRSEFC